ncbi:MAG: hypothetical protein PHY12_12165 [Eubacteriales bacterium]|nr:hypothetical protein [Eubacteriales bacterium]
MDVDRLLYHYLIDGIQRNHRHHVGVELECPLVSEQGGAIDLSIVQPMFRALEPLGFQVTRRASDGSPLAAKDEAGHTLTFDTCYENVEFASASTPTLWDIYDRYRAVLAALQGALKPLRHCLVGVGYNPNIARTQPHNIESELTLAIAEYFREHPVNRHFAKDFYCMVSSEQVHFNTTEQELPKIFEAFTRLDWLNILLFSDSPAHIDGQRYLCARNELYMRSAFRQIGLVGAQQLGPQSAMEIAQTYRDISLFMRQRDGHAQVFSPEPVKTYFDRPDALEEDIHCLDLERNIVTTSYGTVEYRILCTQPFDQAFTPSAFNLGLRFQLEDALACARAFDEKYHLPEPNERNRLASMGVPEFAPREAIHRYASELLILASEGLKARGYGEEAMLRPLLERERLLDSPAAQLVREARVIGAHEALLSRSALGRDFER